MTFDINRVAKVTKPGEKPLYSHHGYVIDKDGTTYAMYHKWWHGAIIALMYPEEAASFTMDGKRNFVTKMMKDEDGDYAETVDSDKLHWPETDNPEDVNVFAFQEFEHAVHRRLQIVRVCPSRMSGICNIDVPKRQMEPAQLASLLAVIKELGLDNKTEVSFDHRDMSLREALKYIHNGEYIEANDEGNEPEDVDPNEPSELDIDPVTHPSYNKEPKRGPVWPFPISQAEIAADHAKMDELDDRLKAIVTKSTNAQGLNATTPDEEVGDAEDASWRDEASLSVKDKAKLVFDTPADPAWQPGGSEMGNSRALRPIIKSDVRIMDATDADLKNRKRDPYQGHKPGAFPSTTFGDSQREDAAIERKRDTEGDGDAVRAGIRASLDDEELEPDDPIDARDDGTEGHGPEDEENEGHEFDPAGGDDEEQE